MGPPSAVRSLPYGCGVRAEPAAATDTGTAVLEEYQALARSIAEQRERAGRLRALANHATAQANEQEHALGDLGEVLGIDPQLCLDDLDVRLGGSACRRSRSVRRCCESDQVHVAVISGANGVALRSDSLVGTTGS